MCFHDKKQSKCQIYRGFYDLKEVERIEGIVFRKVNKTVRMLRRLRQVMETFEAMHQPAIGVYSNILNSIGFSNTG